MWIVRPTPSLQNYINLRGLSNKKIFWRLQNRILSRIWSRIKKGFIPCIKGPGGDCLMKKTESRNSRDTVPFKNVYLIYSLCAQDLYFSLTCQYIVLVSAWHRGVIDTAVTATAVSLTSGTTNFFDYLREFEAIFENTLNLVSGTQGLKSRVRVPLTKEDDSLKV
jgi:hypothetical protein